MTSSKNLKKIIIITCIIILALLLLLAFKDSKYSPVGQLTYEEKFQDSKYLLEVITNIYPYFEEDEKSQHNDFLKRKNEFIYRISNTKNDEEFILNIKEVLDSLYAGFGEIAPLTNVMGESYYKDIDYVPITTKDYQDLYEKLNYWKKIYKNKIYKNKIQDNERDISIVSNDSNLLKNNNSSFFSILKEGNTTLLNFSAKESYEKQWKNELEKNVDMLNSYEYLVLDLRGNSSLKGYERLLNFIIKTPSDATLYKVFAKNKYNENHLAFTRNYEFYNYKAIYEKYPDPIKNKFSPEKFNVYETYSLKDDNTEKYKGKVIILTDEKEVSLDTMMLLSLVKEENLGTIIGTNTITCSTLTNEEGFLFILPRSKLPILVSNYKFVDRLGDSILNKKITPNVLLNIKKDTENIDNSESVLDMNRYSNEDYIFNSSIKYIENN